MNSKIRIVERNKVYTKNRTEFFVQNLTWKMIIFYQSIGFTPGRMNIENNDNSPFPWLKLPLVVAPAKKPKR